MNPTPDTLRRGPGNRWNPQQLQAFLDAHADAWEAAEKWAQAEWHRGNMLAGWAAGNVSNAGCDEASREAGIARDRYAALAAGEEKPNLFGWYDGKFHASDGSVMYPRRNQF